ncbi:MAG: ECF-type sigma factor [Terriglobia bacterium]
MDVPSPRDVTPWLQAWSEGNQGALEQLAPLVYKELHRLAHRCTASGRPHAA